MNRCYESLYTGMLEEIKDSHDTDMPGVERAAVGFWIAANHWEKLKTILCPLAFEQVPVQVDFFRNVKPQFTGYIQYFTMVSESLLFIPDKPESKISYWEEEMKRYDFFCSKHSDFVEYYESGNHELDAAWFTRAPEDWQPICPLMRYDSDKKFCSTHDWLVRGLVAHTLYHDYAGKRKNE